MPRLDILHWQRGERLLQQLFGTIIGQRECQENSPTFRWICKDGQFKD